MRRSIAGYTQITESLSGSLVNSQCTYGGSRISSRSNQLIYYGYDAGGFVRRLFDSVAISTATCCYDAFGAGLSSSSVSVDLSRTVVGYWSWLNSLGVRDLQGAPLELSAGIAKCIGGLIRHYSPGSYFRLTFFISNRIGRSIINVIAPARIQETITSLMRSPLRYKVLIDLQTDVPVRVLAPIIFFQGQAQNQSLIEVDFLNHVPTKGCQ